ncbi:MAG: transglutaminase family protein, partial [Burkholderiales bacterium]
MSIHVALHHRSVYHFDRPVTLSPHEIRLRPAAHARTPVLSYSLQIAPAKHFLNWQQDVYGNYVARAVFPDLTRELAVTVDLVADMTVINPFDFFVENYAERYPFRYPDSLAKELAPFLETAESGPGLTRWLQEFRTTTVRDGTHINDFLVAVNQRIQHNIAYLLRMQPGVQSCEQTLASRSGSCRDSAWLMVNVLRLLGIAARFVSGYLIQLVADVKSLDGPAGPQADFTDLHAWAEAYIPGAGWIGLDPTSGLLTSEGHIPLACTAVPGSAAPIIGMTDVCEATFDVSMTVARLREDPRVTKPYSIDQWNAIVALGHAVDAQLQSGDVRLTQGGEPTFVSVDDMHGDEWNFTALSPAKLKLACALRRRLQRRFAAGALLHFSQGKWYPGEAVPRWALGVYWRGDGKPIWSDPSLIVDDVADNGQAVCTDADGLRFATRLAERLGFNPQYLIPAYEDVRRAVAEEDALPVNIDPLAEDLNALTGRARLARLLRRGLGSVAGYVLPLRAAVRKTTKAAGREDSPDWRSSRWPLKSEHLYLIPGDSPAGFRLPLDALPEVDPADVETQQPRDPFDARPPLADFAALAEAVPVRTDPPPLDPAPKDVVRSALCVEVRDGRLHVFMPPLPYIEDYLALVTALEKTARELRLPIAIEGYPPPADARVKVLNITPDPGVIEVNIHPAQSWDELVANTTILYEEARLARL